MTRDTSASENVPPVLVQPEIERARFRSDASKQASTKGKRELAPALPKGPGAKARATLANFFPGLKARASALKPESGADTKPELLRGL
jgi:hypothetical protein